jgi:hypothetical protein
MPEPSDEDLILYLYGESERRAAIERALAASAEARQRLDALRRLLAAIPVDEPPPLPATYGESVWERLRPRLRPHLPPRPTPAGPRRWLPDSLPVWLGAPGRWAAAAAALALVAAAGFLAGRALPRPEAAFTDEARTRILVAAVAHHLERAELLLVELENGPLAAGADLGAARLRAVDLAAANRLYRQAAQQSGEAALAELLGRLEPVLVEVAHAPARGDAAESAAWRDRLEELDLLFKVRIVGRRLREGAQAPRPPAPRLDAV